MKPLKLELEGFTCYRSRQVISFDDLELFAISGPTGAGKSMLLDAITFGLYGQTARLGRQNLDTLISPGADRLEVDLHFHVATGVFRVVRTAERRASGTVIRNTRVLQLDDAGGWQQLPESERLRDADLKLGEIIGLDYDGFTRSVLLPQGAFDEFLKGDATKRRNLLVSLLNLERIEQMRSEASSRHSAANALVQQLTASLDGDYASATPQLVRELSDQLVALQAARDTGNHELTAFDAQLEQLAELEHLSSELAEVQQQLAGLASQADKMKVLAREEEQGRRALALTPLLAQYEQRRAALTRLELEAQLAAQVLAELEPRGEAARSAAEQAAGQLQHEEPLQLERIANLKTVEPLVATLTRLGGSLALASAGGARNMLSQQDVFSQETVGALRELQAQLPALQRATREQAQSVKQLAEERGRQLSTAKQAEAATTAVKDVTNRGKAARELEKQAQAALLAAEVADQALAIRQHVHSGDDCPVCGQLVAELPASAASQLEELQQQVTKTGTVVTELREEYSRSAVQQAAATERQTQAERSASEAAGRLVTADAALQEARAPFSAADRTGTPAKLAAALEEEYERQLSALARQIVKLTGNLEPTLALKNAEARLKAVRKERADTEKQLSTVKQQLTETRLRHTLQLEAISERSAEVQELATALQNGLQAAGFSDTDGLNSAVRSEAQLASAQQQLQDHAHVMKVQGERRQKLEKLLDGKGYAAEAHAQLRLDRTTLQKRVADLNEQTGRCDVELATARQRLATARQQRKDRDEAQLAFDTWWQLDRDLRGSAFVTYLLSQVQRKLASRASVIIRQVTEGRYDLHLARNDEYQISDAWTADGERRSVKSLSGGETFIVSLALALALSDTIAGGQALGALFLDEGFGTLDTETLESVTQVLETLTQSGRMVGIITHVPELTERLPTRLVVSKGPAGSHVRWDD